jgi:hypothetical protein
VPTHLPPAEFRRPIAVVWEHGDMRRRGLLPTLDTLALLLFVLVGLAQHGRDAALALFLQNAVPLVASWFVVARSVGTYRRPSVRTLLVTWALAVPVGLLLRTAWVGSPRGAAILVFVGIGLAFTLLFLCLARGTGRILGEPHAPAAPDVVR